MRLAFSFLHAHQRFSSFTAELFNSMTANNLFTAQHVQSGRMCVRCGTKNRSDCPSVRLNMAGARPPIFSRAHIHSKHIQTHAARTMMFKVFFLLFFFYFSHFKWKLTFVIFTSHYTCTVCTQHTHTPHIRPEREEEGGDLTKLMGKWFRLCIYLFLPSANINWRTKQSFIMTAEKKTGTKQIRKKEGTVQACVLHSILSIAKSIVVCANIAN